MLIVILQISWVKPICTIILHGPLFGSVMILVSEAFKILIWMIYRYVGSQVLNMLLVYILESRKKI